MCRRIATLLCSLVVVTVLVGLAPARASATACPSDPFEAAQATDAGTLYYWNEVLTDAFRLQGGAPAPLARAAAMMNVGIYDVLNSVYWSHVEDLSTGTPTMEVCGWEPYLVLVRAELSTDADLAAGYAARDILTHALPDQAAFVAGAFAARHPGDFQQQAYALGSFVADTVIAGRANDGSGDTTPYVIDDQTPGAWRPTDTFCTSPATPNWGTVTPFTMTSGDQFRQELPGGYSNYADLLASELYADQVNEVKTLGRNYPSTRILDQTEAAWFWANDLGGPSDDVDTYKPPGQLIEHTRLVAETQPAAIATGDAEDFDQQWSQQGIRVARLFAEVSLALGDAAIAAWDQKYRTAIDLWRPVTAIQEAETDNNLDTVEEAGWQPLSANEDEQHFSPCFPAWVSGHATFGGAWGQVMENEFAGADASDPFPLTLTTEDPHSEITQGVFDERDFDSFAEAAEENARSRIYLGVHYQFDADDGLATGRGLANHISDNYLRWTQTCPAWACVQDEPSPSARISAGDFHTLAIQPDGRVAAWGSGFNGQLGDGSSSDSDVPVPVTDLTGATAVAAGGSHSLAARSDGAVWAWGSNGSGELGDGTTIARDEPVQVTGLTNVTAVAAGNGFSLAAKSDGTVWAWGFNGNGQLGDGTTTGRDEPVQVTGLSNVTAVAAGRAHSAAMTSGGAVWAWGFNGYGQLGDDSSTSRSQPVQVLGLSGATAVAAGDYHTLAVKSDGTAWAWGRNNFGQLGDDNPGIDRDLPVQVEDLTGVTSISAGNRHSVAARSDGTAWAWGDSNMGSLGNGAEPEGPSAVPVQVSDLTHVTAISAGGGPLAFEGGHTVAIQSDRLMWAWGDGTSGQLGNDTLVSSGVPVQVASLPAS